MCRWLHPAIFILVAAFDALDTEAARSGNSASRRAEGVQWSGMEESGSEKGWSLAYWFKRLLRFHGWAT